MKVKIIKGTEQIGGCITEIVSSKKTRIIIDFGCDLDNASKNSTKDFSLVGLTDDTPLYDAVFITHSHGDHIGLAGKINKNIPIYVEEKSLLIHNISCDFMQDMIKLESDNIHTFDINKQETIHIKDINVTPYIIDHSSYNSCMFLIEADNKKILHTGDYRNHGRKQQDFEKTLNKIGKVDLLITEGTTLSRTAEKYQSEFELEKEAEELFKKYNQVFIMQSSTNIDRLLSFYNAKGNKKFVIDTFTEAISNKLPGIPNINDKDVYLWNPNKYEKRKSPEFKDKYMKNPKKNPYGFMPNYVMLVKQSMLPELERFKRIGMFDNACFIYSMWEGYINQDEKMNMFISKMKELMPGYYFLHTSGHADKTAMQLMEKLVNPNKTFIIHTVANEQGSKIFKTYKKITVNKYYKI